MRSLRASPPIPELLGILVVVALAIGVSTNATDPFDRWVIGIVRSDALAGILSPLRWVTELGSTVGITTVAIVTLVLGVVIGPWRHGIAGAVVIGLASIGNAEFKAFMARARPDVLEPVLIERGFSFPSGHSSLSMTAYGILGVLISRSTLPARARQVILVLLGAVILLVGLSRVWLGVHYPTDVVAGWAAGAVIVLLYARFTRSVSLAPIGEGVDADPEAPRSDPPAPG